MSFPSVVPASCGQSPRLSLRSPVYVVAALVTAVYVGALGQGRPTDAKADGRRGDSAAKDSQAEVKAIQDLIAKYAKSVDDADTTLASKVWSDSPDVSFIHPRGHERGWKEVKENVYEKLMGKTFSERKLTVKDVEVNVFGDCAVAVFYWEFVAKLRNNGSTLKTRGRETQVYRKGDRGWSLVHVHYSGMPVTGERRGFLERTDKTFACQPAALARVLTSLACAAGWQGFAHEARLP